MRFAAILLVAFAYSGAFASEPGQPLDCSDWVLLEPGYSCVVKNGCSDSGPDGGCYNGENYLQLDAGGGLLQARRVLTTGMCGQQPLYRLEIFRDSETRTTLAHVDERCVDASHDKIDGALWNGSGNPSGTLLLDPWKGQLLVSMESYSSGASGPGYSSKFIRYAIAGFPTTFDVLQTFTPQASLGFRVPYMPEGMAAADHFDTYWGNLTHPLDFRQAHPLQCGYPAAAPHVGDYLTVADTVPTPAPGQGVYYVTSATYQGARRYGRKTTAGHLSGRDPAALPACGP